MAAVSFSYSHSGKKNPGAGVLQEPGNTHAYLSLQQGTPVLFSARKVSDSTPPPFFMRRHFKLIVTLGKAATVCYKPFTVK